MVKKSRKKKKKIKLSSEGKKQRRLKKAFQKRIITTFKAAGFEYINCENVHKKFGLIFGEVDFVFIFDNIILICEDTIHSIKNIKNHMKKSKILFDEILKDFQQSKYTFIDWLKEKSKEKFNKFDKFDNSEYQYFFLYFYNKRMHMEEIQFMDYIKCIDTITLKYFEQVSKIIKYSSRNEIFRFLNVDVSRLGTICSSKGRGDIDTAVISPESSSGFKKMKTVSFLMRAGDLMRCGYVLRKDNWENSIELYQRLLIQKKIEDIRQYLLNEERGFINNVIVSLPNDVKFYREKSGVDKDKDVKFDDLNAIENLTISIPNEINSIGIIDGQHRIFSYYESSTSKEVEIGKLREKLHLLVTGIVYHKSITEREKRTFESKLFQEINHNAKKVSPDVLLYIKSLQDPYSLEGMARTVIIQLNQSQLFFEKFELSLLYKSQIKSTSLIKFALKDFLEFSDKKETFYKYWKNKDKSILLDTNNTNFEKIFNEYINECAKNIGEYFSAVRVNFKSFWGNPKKNKIFSVASILGFFIAYKKSLNKYDLMDFEFYKTKLSKLKVDFDRTKFHYSSSKGWGDFSRKILKECFDIENNDDDK